MNLGKIKIDKLKEKWPFISVFGEYKTAHTKMKFQCNDCGYTWETTINSVINSACGCPKCKVEEFRRSKAVNHIKYLIKDKFELISVDKNIAGHLIYNLRCNECGDIRSTNVTNISRYGCKKCSSKRAGRLQAMSNDDFINRSKIVHGNFYDYSKTKYVQNKQKVIITCPLHGDFTMTPNKHLYRQQGCPICNGSSLEKIAFELFKELNINFKREYHIHYKNKKMRVDFFIEINNQKYFIELNGEQHYKSVPHWGGYEGLLKQGERDELLKEYCNINNIKLFVLRYDQIIRKELLSIINEITAAPKGETSGKNGEP